MTNDQSIAAHVGTRENEKLWHTLRLPPVWAVDASSRRNDITSKYLHNGIMS